jgi:hypothetical protein
MRLIYLVVIVLLISSLLIQTKALAATQFYITPQNTQQRTYCNSVTIQNSTVNCDTGSLAITYDVDAIGSIAVVDAGTEYKFQEINQDTIRKVNAFNSEKIAQKTIQEKRTKIWASLGISEPTLINRLSSAGSFSDVAKLLKEQYTANGLVELFPVLIPLIGILVFFIGLLWYLISAFQVSILWGLGCLFLPFLIPFIFLFTKWKAASKPFLLMLLSIAFTLSGVFFFGAKKKNLSSPVINTPTTTSSFKETENTYTCNGKIYCSQMTSCGEAMFYLHNCPGVKIDGDHDGIPCEGQWCK